MSFCWVRRSVSCTPPPPARWYIHISPAPSERDEVKCLRPTMNWPSGDQSGWVSRRKVSFDTCLAFDPSRSMTHRLSPPPRSEVKAMERPSGENLGCMSQATPEAMARASPPLIGMT
ncbi:hypothetical protein D3C86_1522750 [compost metagenome]